MEGLFSRQLSLVRSLSRGRTMFVAVGKLMGDAATMVTTMLFALACMMFVLIAAVNLEVLLGH